jgi:hypothetical protein
MGKFYVDLDEFFVFVPLASSGWAAPGAIGRRKDLLTPVLQASGAEGKSAENF